MWRHNSSANGYSFLTAYPTPWFSFRTRYCAQHTGVVCLHFLGTQCGGTSPKRIILSITHPSPKLILRAPYSARESKSLSTVRHVHTPHLISISDGVSMNHTHDGMRIYISLRNLSANVKHPIDTTHHSLRITSFGGLVFVPNLPHLDASEDLRPSRPRTSLLIQPGLYLLLAWEYTSV